MSNMRGTALPEDQTNITFSFFTTPYFFSTSIPQIPKDLEKNVVVLFFKVFFFFLICSEFRHTLKWNVLEFTCLPQPETNNFLK